MISVIIQWFRPSDNMGSLTNRLLYMLHRILLKMNDAFWVPYSWPAVLQEWSNYLNIQCLVLLVGFINC